VKFVSVTLGLGALGALAGGVIGAVTHWTSGPSDFGGSRPEWVVFLGIIGLVLGMACGLVGSVIWALWHRFVRGSLPTRPP
jgi:hypothetical protein